MTSMESDKKMNDNISGKGTIKRMINAKGSRKIKTPRKKMNIIKHSISGPLFSLECESVQK
jgi:hypothetical protein